MWHVHVHIYEGCQVFDKKYNRLEIVTYVWLCVCVQDLETLAHENILITCYLISAVLRSCGSCEVLDIETLSR